MHISNYEQNMSIEKFPAFLKSYPSAEIPENNCFRVPTHLQFTALFLKGFRLRLYCYTWYKAIAAFFVVVPGPLTKSLV
jgi:hypothetical protein